MVELGAHRVHKRREIERRRRPHPRAARVRRGARAERERCERRVGPALEGVAQVEEEARHEDRAEAVCGVSRGRGDVCGGGERTPQ